MEHFIPIASLISEEVGQDFAFAFLSVLFEGLPFILIGTLISGFIDVYLPSSTMDKLLPKNRWLSIFACGLLGIIIPVCECTVVPVIRRLIAKGLPLGSAFAYMLAAPIVNPITFMSTYTAFATEPLGMAVARMLLGYLVAVTVGILILSLPIEKILKRSIIQRLHFSGKGHSTPPCCEHEHARDDSTCCSNTKTKHFGHQNLEHYHSSNKEKVFNKCVAAVRTSVKDFLDVAVYFVIGITLMTIFKKATNTNALINYLAEDGRLLEGTAFMIALSFILSLCSTSDAFVVATSFERLSRVPKMAFLVFGPMMDIKLMLLYQSLMKLRTVLTLALLLFVLVTATCLTWGHFYATSPSPADIPIAPPVESPEPAEEEEVIIIWEGDEE